MMNEGQQLSTITPDDDIVTLQSNRTGEFTEVIDIEIPEGYRFEFPNSEPIEMFLFTHEAKTTNGTAGDTETFTLGNDLVDSPSLESGASASGFSDLVLYENGSLVAPDSVDYANNAFDYTDDGTNNDLDVYYVWDERGKMEGRAYSTTSQAYDVVFGETPGALHTSKTFSALEEITYNNDFVLEEYEHLRFHVNTQVDLTNWDSADSPAFFRLPAYKRRVKR